MSTYGRRSAFRLLALLFCIVGLACCTACMAEPLLLGISAPPYVCNCGGNQDVIVSASDSDVCCAYDVCDGLQLDVQVPTGWELVSSETAHCELQKTYRYNGTASPGKYTFSASVHDLNNTPCAGEDDPDPPPVSAEITVKDSWSAEPAMTSPVITGAEPDQDVLPGTEVVLHAKAEDKDQYNCTEVSGRIRYDWGCQSPSTFKNGQWQGESVTWVAPSIPGEYTIYVHAVDDIGPLGDVCGYAYDQMTSSSITIHCHTVVIDSFSAVPGVGGGDVDGDGEIEIGTSGPIMTGGVENAVHQATLAAKIKPESAGGCVRFEILGTTGVNIPAHFGSVGTTGVLIPVDSAGEARATLTSSDKDQETIYVQASYVPPYGVENPGTHPETIEVQQATGVHTVFECDPPSVPADGASVTSIRFRLMQYGGTIPVPGHSITFSIESVEDIYDIFVQGPPWPDGYGTVDPFPVVTDADGYAVGRYYVGTLGGTVNIKAEDYHDQALEEVE